MSSESEVGFASGQLTTASQLIGTFGGWSGIAHPAVAVAMAQAGYDWLLFDLEHGIFTLPELRSSLDAVRAVAPVPVFARLPKPGSELTQPVVDLGVDAVLIPQVRTVDDVHRAVELCLLPPEGRRGLGVGRYNHYGTLLGGMTPAFAQRPLVLVQIETTGALEVVEDLARLPLVDSLFIGPSDLGLALRTAGSVTVGATSIDGVEAAINIVSAVAHSAGKPLGMWVPDQDTAERHRAQVDYFGVSTDVRILARAARLSAASMRELLVRADAQEP